VDDDGVRSDFVDAMNHRIGYGGFVGLCAENNCTTDAAVMHVPDCRPTSSYVCGLKRISAATSPFFVCFESSRIQRKCAALEDRTKIGGLRRSRADAEIPTRVSAVQSAYLETSRAREATTRAEPGLSARDQIACMMQAPDKCRKAQHNKEDKHSRSKVKQ
jgi:hypothetical protein